LGFIERLERRDMLSHVADGPLDADWLVWDEAPRNDVATSVVTYSDGRILVAGTTAIGTSRDIAVVRYQTNGSLDESFGNGGRVLLDGGENSGQIAVTDLLRQPDDRIIVVVQNGTEISLQLVRMAPDGTLDVTWDADGWLTVVGFDSVVDAQVAPNGDVVVAGNTADTALLVRLCADGSLDTTFGQSGRVALKPWDAPFHASALTVQPDGGIVVVGEAPRNSAPQVSLLVKLTADGGVDEAFGQSGTLTAPASTYRSDDLTVFGTAGGSISWVGLHRTSTTSSYDNEFFVGRALENGVPDLSFDGDGYRSYQSPMPAMSGIFASATAEGGLMILTLMEWWPLGGWRLNKILSDGQVDTTFRWLARPNSSSFTRGITHYELDNLPRAMTVTANGAVVVVGSSGRQTSAGRLSGHWAVTRYTSTGELDLEFAGTGTTTTNIAGIELVGYSRLGRVYNRERDAHFFTTSREERDRFVAAGLRDESETTVGFGIPTEPIPETTRVYRLYDWQSGQRYLTRHAAERDHLLSLGWRQEPFEGYIYTERRVGTTEVFMLYNRRSGSHLYLDNTDAARQIVAMFPTEWERHASLGFAVRTGQGFGLDDVHRVYNPDRDAHVFTTDVATTDELLEQGGRLEQPPHAAFSLFTPAASGFAPVDRLMSPDRQHQILTSAPAERANLIARGWSLLSREGYISESPRPGTKEVFNLYNQRSGSHLNTVNNTERLELLNRFPDVWVQHASLGYAVPACCISPF
jgi:uncharacterized delta-60 repeat protein